MIELVHSTCERAAIEAPVTSSMLPDTVHAAVQARLDQLEACERAVVQVASISLRRFQRGMLYALVEEYSRSETDRALDGLLARDFIIGEGLGTDTYTFRHMLIALFERDEHLLHGMLLNGC